MGISILGKSMAEIGWSKLQNNILEKLGKTHLIDYEWRFLMILWRKTYGFNKDEDHIPIKQFVDATGIHKEHISRTKKMLIQRKIVTPSGNSRIKFNKNTDEWIELPNGVTNHSLPNGVTGVTKRGNKELPNGVYSKETLKETNTKENIKKDLIPYSEIIADLNQKAGTNYRPTGEMTKKAIRARYSEGFTLDDFRKVHSKKCDEWKGTEYEKHLTPDTLYRPSNFEKYLNQVIRAPKPKNLQMDTFGVSTDINKEIF